MNKKQKYIEPIGVDNNIKSTLASVPKSYGFPTLSNYRCCTKDFGTHYEELTTDHMPVTNFGLPHYSDLNKCFSLSDKDVKNINNEMEKNNLNTEDIFNTKNKKYLFNKRNVNLGKNVLSYKIVSDKQKQ